MARQPFKGAVENPAAGWKRNRSRCAHCSGTHRQTPMRSWRTHRFQRDQQWAGQSGRRLRVGL